MASDTTVAVTDTAQDARELSGTVSTSLFAIGRNPGGTEVIGGCWWEGFEDGIGETVQATSQFSVGVDSLPNGTVDVQAHGITRIGGDAPDWTKSLISGETLTENFWVPSISTTGLYTVTGADEDFLAVLQEMRDDENFAGVMGFVFVNQSATSSDFALLNDLSTAADNFATLRVVTAALEQSESNVGATAKAFIAGVI